jgi:hypothetical protein
MADNFFGPAGSDAVTTRPSATPEVARAGAAARWFTPCTSASAADGTRIATEWLNLVVANLDGVRDGAGIDSGEATPGADDVLLKAIIALITARIPTVDGFLALTGGTMTGDLTLRGAPTTDLMAATKAYVDAVSAALAGYLLKSGGTMTGDLTLKGAPTTDLMAATKAYVDSIGATVLSRGSGYLALRFGPVGSPILQIATGSQVTSKDVAQTVTLPTTFPTAVTAASVSTNAGDEAGLSDAWFEVISKTTSTVRVICQSFSSDATTSGGMTPVVTAWGY